MRIRTLLTLSAVSMVLIGCLAQPTDLGDQLMNTESLPGFWLGLWHGFTLLFSFIISLFRDDVTVYSAVNNGGWYNFGYLFGIMSFFGGGGHGSKRRTC